MGATVIVNERSSRVARHLRELPQMLAARGIEVDAFVVVADERALRGCAKRAVKAKTSLLIVGGGDGSMTTVANVLAYRKTTLGILPLGTGNSFAQTLSLPTDLESAIDTIAAGRAVTVDLGTINGKYFANFATIGLSSEIAEATPHALKPIVGTAAYVAGGIVPFLRHRPFRARIRFDDAKSTFPTHQIVVANGRFFGSQPVTPDATIKNGKLAFFTTSGVSHLAVAEMYVAMAFGKQTQLPDAISFTARDIVVKAKPKQRVTIDGNPFGTTPVRLGIAKNALRVIVPAAFADAPA